MKIGGYDLYLCQTYLCQISFLAFLQDECREFRDLFKNGKLSCTRENDPVRDSSGKQHSNKCIMCAEKLSGRVSLRYQPHC
uniref:Kazal-like domain-containing protein n=1 Tax=Nothoprocta perdicaria TaxID=30464 RepID=A0A8C6Z0W0_NOTPE